MMYNENEILAIHQAVVVLENRVSEGDAIDRPEILRELAMRDIHNPSEELIEEIMNDLVQFD